MIFDISFLMHRLSAISPPYWLSPVPGSLARVQLQLPSRSSQLQRLSEPKTTTYIPGIVSVIAWQMVSPVCSPIISTHSADRLIVMIKSANLSNLIQLSAACALIKECFSVFNQDEISPCMSKNIIKFIQKYIQNDDLNGRYPRDI